MNDVVIATFSELSDARAASSELERLASEGVITVRAGAVVVREADGRFRVPDGGQSGALDASDEHALRDLLRSLVGPVGSLSRLAPVALAGSGEEGQSAGVPERVLGSLARRLAPGTTALVADIEAPIPRALSTAIEASGGSMTRRLQADIEAELAATLDVLNAHAPETVKPSDTAVTGERPGGFVQRGYLESSSGTRS
jgi:uncharacterized membrane protein